MFGQASLSELFWSNVEKHGPNDCWPWKGITNGIGYGVFTLFSNKLYAHRQAYSEAKGIIPDGLIIRHHCDNPICCNPSHLEVGTKADNTQDAVRRGRFAGRKTPRGDGHGMAIISSSDVLKMREKYNPDKRGHIAEAARDFAISSTQAARILRRQAWRSVPEAGDVQ